MCSITFFFYVCKPCFLVYNDIIVRFDNCILMFFNVHFHVIQPLGCEMNFLNKPNMNNSDEKHGELTLDNLNFYHVDCSAPYLCGVFNAVALRIASQTYILCDYSLWLCSYFM